MVMNNTYAILFFIFFLSISCTKKDDTPGDGISVIKINLTGAQSLNLGERLSKNAPYPNVLHSRQLIADAQTKEIAIDNMYKVSATLTLDDVRQSMLTDSKLSMNSMRVKNMSLGSTQSNLAQGVKYRMLLYDNTGAFVEYKDYEVGVSLTSDDSFRLVTGLNYTFIAYSVGSNSTSDLDRIMPTGNLNDALFEEVDGNKNFMYYIKPASSYQEGLTTLNIVLEHQFSQIKTIVQLDNAVAGQLASIEATITPHINKVNVPVRNGIPDFDNGTVSDGAIVDFINTANNRKSEATTIVTSPDQTANNGGTLNISSITIDGKSNTQVSPIEGLKIVPGGRYTLTLNVTKFTPDIPDGVEINGKVWAKGNLIYDRTTEVYSFAAPGEHGDYWFQDYCKPKRTDISNSSPTSEINGLPGCDPCKKVLPLDAWRLPTEYEFRSLAQPNSNNTPLDRYVGNYNGAASNQGMFVDTAVDPGESRTDYLFFSFGGRYQNSDNISNKNSSGHYLARGIMIFPYTEAQLNSNKSVEYPTGGTNNAISIRCIQNN